VADGDARPGFTPAEEEQARAVPGIGDKIRKLDEDLEKLGPPDPHAPSDVRDALEARRRNLILTALGRPVDESSVKLGTFDMAVDPHAAQTAASLEGMARNVERARRSQKGVPFADVQALAEAVVALLDKQRRPTPERRGPKVQEVSRATKQKVAELRIAGETSAEIRRQTGLSKTVTDRLVGGVDAVLSQALSGRY
jgi:hypothetical protein